MKKYEAQVVLTKIEMDYLEAALAKVEREKGACNVQDSAMYSALRRVRRKITQVREAK